MVNAKTTHSKWLVSSARLTLIELLVALGIFSTLIYAVAMFMDGVYSQQKMSDEDEEVIMLRDELITKMSCPDTIWGPLTGGSLLVNECRFTYNGGPCNTKNYLAIKAAKPDIGLGGAPTIIESRAKSLPEGSYTKYKSLDVRASCTCCPECAGGKKIMVEFKRLRSSGAKSTWKDLFNGIPLRCVIMG